MVRRRQAGESLRSIARSMACSPSTVKTQADRYEQADDAARADFSCLAPRRPVPRSCPWKLSAEQEQLVLRARERTNWGPMRLAALTGLHRSTVWKVLWRHGRSREAVRPSVCEVGVCGWWSWWWLAGVAVSEVDL
jgi:transcriptional regulator of acetoin/glycerol metabolism